MRLRKKADFAAACGALVVLSALASSPAKADLRISSAPTSNVTCTSGVCAPTTSGKAVLNVSQLEGLLAAGNVTVTGMHNHGNITIIVSAGISWVSAYTLTLNSDEAIKIDNTIAIDGSGGLNFNTNGGQTISFDPRGNVTSLSTANNLTINGVAYTFVDSVETLASAIAANPAGNYALAGTYDAHPDGTYKTAPVSATFTGTFDGLGNEISDLTVVDSHVGYAALFAQLGSSATVRDLTLRHAHVVGRGENPVFIGALAGISYGYIYRCFANGHALGSGTDGVYEGGLVGQNNGTVANSGADVAVDATTNSMSGGLIGLSIRGLVVYSFATGTVTGGGSQSFLGGLVGNGYELQLTNSYAAGSVSGNPDDSVGGLIGWLQDTSVMQSYSSGHVSGGTSHVAFGFAGGLAGFDDGSNSYTDSYWDTTTSGFSGASQGTGNYPNIPGITGLTTAQFQSELPSGLVPPIWGEKANINDGLPYLLFAPRQ